jgi:histidinol phosphatase-like enzyme
MENYPVLKHFSKFVLSYKVGSRKPENGIYEYLIEHSGNSPAQNLFIDDKMPFVTAAREHGIQAWQFTSCEILKQQLKEMVCRKMPLKLRNQYGCPAFTGWPHADHNRADITKFSIENFPGHP